MAAMKTVNETITYKVQQFYPELGDDWDGWQLWWPLPDDCTDRLKAHEQLAYARRHYPHRKFRIVKTVHKETVLRA